jgi:hypothetical protein
MRGVGRAVAMEEVVRGLPWTQVTAGRKAGRFDRFARGMLVQSGRGGMDRASPARHRSFCSLQVALNHLSMAAICEGPSA